MLRLFTQDPSILVDMVFPQCNVDITMALLTVKQIIIALKQDYKKWQYFYSNS